MKIKYNKFINLMGLFLLAMPLLSQDLDDLTFGTEQSLDIATWNIEWFPKNGQTTVDYVTEIIYQLDLDVLAMQELDNKNMFDQMLDQLVDYNGYYESDWFAGLAYIYKTDIVEINDIYEIYTTSSYWTAFPRSPMVMDMNFMGENYFIINNHFKCCGDGILDMDNDNDEEKRRYDASNLLKEYVDHYLADKKVIILGDLNDDIAESSQNNIFQMIINDTENYLFADIEIANGSNLDWSYPSWPSHLDHILITNEIFADYANWDVLTIKIDDYLDGGWSVYDQNISDHRPVGMHIYNTIDGDLNNDTYIDILDVIIIVNNILNPESTMDEADINEDGEVNIADIVDLVNMILAN